MKALVADDEPLARARLVRMLAKIGDVVVVAEAGSGIEAVSLARDHEPDVMLLDIDMPGLDGFGVAESCSAPLVVFTTAHAQYAAAAFDAEAIDYLLKPVVEERLERAIDRVRKRLADRPAAIVSPANNAADLSLTVHEAGVVRFFDARAVTRFTSVDKYTVFNLEGREHIVKDSLAALEERLAPAGFVRVHRSELVRLDSVVALRPDAGGALLELKDGQTAAVSRRYLQAVKLALGMKTDAPKSR
jgi:two-component system LytT family response regulator